MVAIALYSRGFYEQHEGASAVAQKVQVLLTCDLDEEEVEAAETVTFGYDGTNHEIELCATHLEEFNEWMQSYVAAGRRAGGSRRRRRAGAGANGTRASGGADLGAIREWARSNGFNVSDRGRISTEVRDAFDAAQGSG